MTIKISDKALKRIENSDKYNTDELLLLCDSKDICPSCGGNMVIIKKNEKWCENCNWSKHISLARALLTKLDNFGASKNYTWDDFYDEMFIPKSHRTDFATAAILRQATNLQMQSSKEKSFGDI